MPPRRSGAEYLKGALWLACVRLQSPIAKRRQRNQSGYITHAVSGSPRWRGGDPVVWATYVALSWAPMRGGRGVLGLAEPGLPGGPSVTRGDWQGPKVRPPGTRSDIGRKVRHSTVPDGVEAARRLLAAAVRHRTHALTPAAGHRPCERALVRLGPVIRRAGVADCLRGSPREQRAYSYPLVVLATNPHPSACIILCAGSMGRNGARDVQDRGHTHLPPPPPV